MCQFFCGHLFLLLGYTPRSLLAGSCGNSRFEELPGWFPKQLKHVIFHQQCVRITASPPPRQHLPFQNLVVAIPAHVEWSLIVVLICFLRVAHDVEHLFMCVLVTSGSSLEKCPFGTLAYFLIGLSFVEL